MPHAAFYVVQHRTELKGGYKLHGFQCRTQHFMWCNTKITKQLDAFGVSMPHAALYVVQQLIRDRRISLSRFQCRTQHFMWCNEENRSVLFKLLSFNAARSILCGAT